MDTYCTEIGKKGPALFRQGEGQKQDDLAATAT